VDERRLPTKDELDDWAGGRPIVVYNIDGHCIPFPQKCS
jgi:predicted amidohydrolase YtcJ